MKPNKVIQITTLLTLINHLFSFSYQLEYSRKLYREESAGGLACLVPRGVSVSIHHQLPHNFTSRLLAPRTLAADWLLLLPSVGRP